MCDKIENVPDLLDYISELEKSQVKLLEQIQWMREQFKRIQLLAESDDPLPSMIYGLALIGERYDRNLKSLSDIAKEKSIPPLSEGEFRANVRAVSLDEVDPNE